MTPDALMGVVQHYGPEFLAGGTLTAAYVAIWKHAPERFPRSLDEWWGWFRGANQEIANQRSGNPTQPELPAPAQPKK